MAIKQTGGTKLTGINPLAYTGVEPSSPPQLVRFDRAPTNRDFGFNLGDLWIVEEPFEVWMLLDKPQNVAFWALIYPQAGGAGGIDLIHTNTTDVTADVNGAITIEGGENINIGAAGAHTVVVNLNRFILWPTTNNAGTEGVIYLDNDRFLHNFGDAGSGDFNTFLGINSGNFTLSATARENTGIGSFALVNVTDGDSNTALGADALGALTVGIGNIAIGTSAGNNVIARNDNILIGNQGTLGDTDDSVIRIGTETVQTTAHMAGIFGSTVAATVTPNTVLNVDDTGQIGQLELTSSGATIAITQPSNGIINLEAIGGGGAGGNPFAFSYILATNSNPQAQGTVYELGTDVVLTKLFDVGNNVFPGDGLGSPAVFTAPVTGKYYFEFLAANTASTNLMIPSIVTTIRTYQLRPPGGATLYSLVTDMNMGDTATFELLVLTVGNTTISGNNSANPVYNQNSTRISGFLIPEGASGGNFTQPFLGIQQVNTGSVTGDGTIYLLGSRAPLVEQFDVGNNFNPGDGLGTEASFVAPTTGIYQFFVGSASSSPRLLGGIDTPAKNYFSLLPGAAAIHYVQSYTCSLTIADIVTFPVASYNGPKNVIIYSSYPGFGSEPNGINVTYVSGYRIS